MVGDNKISWRAPIIPSISLAGIPIGLDVVDFDNLLELYLIDSGSLLYKFEESPVLRLAKHESDFESIYLFHVHDVEMTNWRLYFASPNHAGVNTKALAVIFRNGSVHAVKVWNFELAKEGMKPKNVYSGRLPGGIGLDDPVNCLLQYTDLQFDEGEGWFYTDENYGGVEVTGYGDLADYPDQTIMAIAVIARSPVQSED